MSTFPGSPRLLKGGIALVNPRSSTIELIIPLQYNPDTITRTIQPGNVGGEGSFNPEALRITGPPVETYKLEAEIDGTDNLELADITTVEAGIQPILSALETILYPKSSHLVSNNTLARIGTIEITPMESSLVLFIWNKNRIVPVQITEFSITEEAFDVNLNPIRAKLSLGMRVLTVDDVGFDHKGGSLYMNYQSAKENLARMYTSGKLSDLGINSI